MNTYTITIKESDFVTYFGDDGIDNLAAFNGYPEKINNPDYIAGNSDYVEKMISNPDYVPAQGSEQIVDPEWDKPADYDEKADAEMIDGVENPYGPVPMIDNPDYVPASGGEPKIPNPEYIAEEGEPFIDNPITKGEWLIKRVAIIGLDNVAKPYLKHVKEEYGNTGLNNALAAVEAFKDTVNVDTM